MPTPPPPRPPREPAGDGQARRITRAQAVEQLAARWQPGDHATLIGPTGRGKSTLLAQVLPRCKQFDRVVIMSPKGADPAFSHLGHPTKVWPPKRPWQQLLADIAGGRDDRHAERPLVWRVEIPVLGLDDLARLSTLHASVLKAAMRRRQNPPDSLAVVIDDSRMVSDAKHLNLGALIVGNMLVARSKKVSIANLYQAPRWVPREGLDQSTQILIWRNRDKDVGKRLAEVVDLDPGYVLDLLRGLEYHECLWIDGRTDELFIVGQ